MQVFYDGLEQGYAPRYGFFNWAMAPFPNVPSLGACALRLFDGLGLTG